MLRELKALDLELDPYFSGYYNITVLRRSLFLNGGSVESAKKDILADFVRKKIIVFVQIL